MSNEWLVTQLASMDKQYDPLARMVREPMRSPGYHTTLKVGVPVCSTRTAMDYALACLMVKGADEAWRRDRAAEVIAAVLGLQDADPLSATYGVWPWFAEESLAQMSPPDFNWADFIGTRIAQMLRFHADRLGPDLCQQLREALRRAALCIYKRNIRAGYTNIAIMGAGVCAMGAELAGVEALLPYARARLASVLAEADRHGSLCEYNSPTYTTVAIEECERILAVVRDEEMRAHAEGVRRLAWGIVANHWHAPTGQWSGPHARAYNDRITAAQLAFLLQRGAIEMPVGHEDADSREFLPGERLVSAMPCPTDIRQRMARPIEQPVENSVHFQLYEDGFRKRATFWMDRFAALGSVNRDTMWDQRRPLIAYWRAEGPAAVLRLRLLADGMACPAGRVMQSQRGPRVLSMLRTMSGAGRFHPMYDIPPDGRMALSRLALGLWLDAPDARCEMSDDAHARLWAGTTQAVLHLPAATVDGVPVRWSVAAPVELPRRTTRVGVECVLSEPADGKLDIGALDVRVALGVELLPVNEASRLPLPQLRQSGETLLASWDEAGLPPVQAPLATGRFQW